MPWPRPTGCCHERPAPRSPPCRPRLSGRAARRCRRVVVDRAVILLSADVHARFPDLGADLEDFDRFCREHERRFAREFVPAEDDDPALSLEERITALLYSALARARLLAWTIAHCVNSDLAVGAFLATRAHFEMTAFVAYALREVRRWRSVIVQRGVRGQDCSALPRPTDTPHWEGAGRPRRCTRNQRDDDVPCHR